MLLWAVVCLCFWVEGRERGVDCMCATEPPCSSGDTSPDVPHLHFVGDAGAAWLAQALEKNTTLQWLDLNGEFVVLCCVCGGG